MTQKFRNKYRLLAPVDYNTNDFPKTLKDTNEEIDIYIPCSNDGQISYYGKGILEFYIPHLKKGNNIVKEIYAKYINPENIKIASYEVQRKGKAVTVSQYKVIDNILFKSDINSNKHIIFKVRTTDEEVFFQFKYSDHETIFPFLSPLKNGCRIPPFSNKNLPKKDYKIPDEDLDLLTSKTEIYSGLLNVGIGILVKSFIKDIHTINPSIKDVKSDMRKKCLTGQKYIHAAGLWNEFVDYVEKNLKNKYSMENK